MPFKLKLKKTRQYNVASKSLFVISVELLDGGVADCTLSVDSSGQECLDNVCQRQAINQPEFFGLRYVNRSQQPRWVQLDRPLKRQLDKHASSHQLYLRVMYYIISGTSLITDEVTRYHYFLQLKNDLIEGRIICDFQQAVVLASYSRQAEYGNHDRERHTVEYLKNLLTFPKQMLDGGQIIDGSTLAETGRLEWLTENVIHHHMALHNMSQAQAEEGFITTCQQLRGYGQEMFSARDHGNQTEVTIAISLTGIRVLSETSDTPHFYRWMDITNVINHKRSFSIECHSPSESAMFTLASPEDGKYVWRMCVLQHTFYMRHQNQLSNEHTPNFQDHGLSESREELDCEPPGPGPGPALRLSSAHRAHSTSCLELEPERLPPQIHRALLPQYRLAPDYETAIQQKYQQQRYASPSPPAPPAPDVTRRYVPYLDRMYANVYKPPPAYPLASNSTPDLAAASQALCRNLVSGSSPDLVSARYLGLNLLPEFRPSALPVLYPPPRYNPPNPLESHEPIYENVPAAWRVQAARARTRSLTAGEEPPRPRPAPRAAPPSLENVTLTLNRTSLEEPTDETPYQSLSTHRVTEPPHIIHPPPPILTTSTITDISSLSNKTDISKSNTTLNSIQKSTEDIKDTKPSAKEKKRRRWGVFMGRATKTDEKSATLGREKEKTNGKPPPHDNRHRWSTGLPKYQPLPPTITKETMCQILERKMSDEALSFAFEQIPKGRSTDGSHRTALAAGAGAGGAHDTLPYDDNRVRLQPGPHNPLGYINASHVTMTVGSTQRFYVVVKVCSSGCTGTAGGGCTSCAGLWECVWTAGAGLVAVLAGPGGCLPHLPATGTASNYGHFQVTTSASVRASWGICSRVLVRKQGGGAGAGATGTRTLWHVQYTRWPLNQTLPDDVDSFLSFLSEVSGLRSAWDGGATWSGGGGGGAPLVLACERGAGRSGTALAAHLLFDILDHNQELDIPRTISQLHQQRANLIQNVHQYKFLHQLLIQYLKQSRLI